MTYQQWSKKYSWTEIKKDLQNDSVAHNNVNVRAQALLILLNNTGCIILFQFTNGSKLAFTVGYNDYMCPDHVYNTDITVNGL